MTNIRILHLSDLHFSEGIESEFWVGLTEQDTRLIHQYGHNPHYLIALDEKLKKINWDIVIVSGDLSRIGHLNSFSNVKKWLYDTIPITGGGEIGLNLNQSNKKCFVIPGNHDSFNGHSLWGQYSLANYNQFFPEIIGRSIEKLQVNGFNVNIHLYDSTYKKRRSFTNLAEGYLPATVFKDWKTDDETLDIVVVHHHLAQAPEQKRQRKSELINAHEFLTFLLPKHVNAVLFGHTHESFFESVSAEILKSQIMFRRKSHRLFRQSLPQYFSEPEVDSLSFSRVRTKSGRFPSFDKYFEYLYIKNILKKDINGPELFNEPRDFYEHINFYRSNYDECLRCLRRKKVAFSMAPSPTYVAADINGFHILNFTWDGSKFMHDCERYFWDGAEFNLEINT